MENVKKLCRNYDKIVSALDQNPVISKSECLEINLKKMIKVKSKIEKYFLLLFFLNIFFLFNFFMKY